MQHRITLRRATLTAGVALGVMFAAATEAKPIKHHAPAGPTKTELELKAQVDSLKAEVQALESRLDAQAQTQQQAQAQVQAQVQAAQTQAQAAQTQAQAAQTQVQAAQTQIQTLPGRSTEDRLWNLVCQYQGRSDDILRREWSEQLFQRHSSVQQRCGL
jgi:hypothetical protein